MERPFTHQFVTAGLRRIFVRGHANVCKRLLIQVCGFNLGLLMRHLTGVGTPRSLQTRVPARPWTHFSARTGRWIGWNRIGERFWASIRPNFAVLDSSDPSINHPSVRLQLVSEVVSAWCSWRPRPHRKEQAEIEPKSRSSRRILISWEN